MQPLAIGRAVIMTVAGTALFAWLGAGTTPALPAASRQLPSAPSRPAPPTSQSVDGSSERSPVIEPLHSWPRAAAPLSTKRNLFAFRTTPTAAVTATSAPQAPRIEAPFAAAAGQRATPPFLLEGLAEDPGPDGAIRAAIISDGRQLFIVKVGEEVALGYRVASISDSVVELEEATGGVRIRLALK